MHVQCACATALTTSARTHATNQLCNGKRTLHTGQLSAIFCHYCTIVHCFFFRCKKMFLAHECNLGNQTTKVLQAKAAALYYCILVVMKIWSYRCIECLFKTIYTEPSATIWDGKGTVPLLLLSLLLKRPNETKRNETKWNANHV